MRTMIRLLFGLSLLVAAPLWAQTKPAAQATAQPQLPAGVALEQDLHYGSAAGRGQLLDLYWPSKDDSPRPLIIWIHGGGWSAGDKKGCPAVMMVERGYAVASLNYRLTQEAIFPAQIYDCKGAIRWLRAHSKQYHL